MSTPAKKTQAVAVAKPKPQEVAAPAAPQTQAAAIFAMIERASRDPTVDIGKMKELMEMAREAKREAAHEAYTRALAQLQAELPTIDERGVIRNKAGEIQSRYAKWEDINEAIQPILHKHGFTLTFRAETTETRVTTFGILEHSEGHREQTSFNLPVDTGPGRNAVQSVASAFSYGKRYCGTALLNITSRAPQDADDDASGTEGYLTEDMVAELRDLIQAVGAIEAKFCQKFLRVESLDKTPAKRFNEAVQELKRFGREERGLKV